MTPQQRNNNNFLRPSLIVIFLLLPAVSSKITNKTLDTLESFAFIDRFVFYPTPQNVEKPTGSDKNNMELYNYGLIEFNIEYGECDEATWR